MYFNENKITVGSPESRLYGRSVLENPTLQHAHLDTVPDAMPAPRKA